MKTKKASGKGGIPNEAWMYGGKKVKRLLAVQMSRVWTEGEY